MLVDSVERPTDGSSVAPNPTSWIGRFLWLGPRVAEARASAFRSGKPGFELFEVARQLYDETGRIRRGGRSPWAVLVLDCMSLEWLARAHLARTGRSTGTDTLGADDWTALQSLPCGAAAFASFPASHLPTLTAAVGPDRFATLASLTPEARDSLAAHVSQLVEALIEPLEVEANLLAWALFARWSRIAAVALALVLMVAGAAFWIRSKTSPNLALHRSVRASSLNGYGPDATRLVDGVTDEIGFHTNGGDQQWVVIDLGQVKKIDKIVVFNRPDCCGERAVPLRVAISGDNSTFTQIAEKLDSFDKWTVTNLRAEGRYVRLENQPPNFFHLAEVQIY